MKKEIQCNHYKGNGFYYELIGTTLLLCKRCEKKLRKAIFEQNKIEKEIKKQGIVKCKLIKVKKK